MALIDVLRARLSARLPSRARERNPLVADVMPTFGARRALPFDPMPRYYTAPNFRAYGILASGTVVPPDPRTLPRTPNGAPVRNPFFDYNA